MCSDKIRWQWKDAQGTDVLKRLPQASLSSGGSTLFCCGNSLASWGYRLTPVLTNLRRARAHAFLPLALHLML